MISGDRPIKIVEMRDSQRTRYDDTARVRADAESRPLGGRRKWSTGLSPTGWFFLVFIAVIIVGVVLAVTT